MKSTDHHDTLRASALLYTFIALGLSVLTAVLGIFSVMRCYDASIGYYARGAVLPIILTILCAASVIFFAVFAILRFRKRDVAYAKNPSLAVRITALASAAVALLLAITDLRSGASILSLLLGLGACLYFLLIATKNATPALSLAFGVCAIFRWILVIAASYRDVFLPMNSPEKTWLHLAAVAGIFFLISELRALISKPYTATWFFAAASATLLSATAAVTMLTGELSHRFYGKTSLVFSVLLLCVAAYAGARLVSMALCPKPEEEVIEPTEKIEEIEEPEATEETEEE